jgi:hypothetical protein
MDQWMARCERNLAAGNAPYRQPERGSEGNGLRVPIVRVHDIETVISQPLAQGADISEPNQFLLFHGSSIP